MNSFRPHRPEAMPPVVKNLLILNVLAYIAIHVAYFFNVDIIGNLGLFYVKSDFFRPVQFVTYMFLHAPVIAKFGILHIVFNMFALWMFGSRLENAWGPQRFLFFYLSTGLGAALIHALVTYFHVEYLTETGGNSQLLYSLKTYPTIGASGAVFGILAAFAMLFPNTQLMFILIPVPVKAKYFVLFYAIAELYLGIQSLHGSGQGMSIAHFAHLGGALFGFIIVKIWGTNRDRFY